MKTKRHIKTEAGEAMAFIEWCDLHPTIKGLMTHIPNERKCSYSYGKQLKSVGVRAGFPDYFLPISRGNFHGLFIELKRDGQRLPSIIQADWLQKLREQGYDAHVAYGADNAIRIVREYLG